MTIFILQSLGVKNEIHKLREVLIVRMLKASRFSQERIREKNFEKLSVCIEKRFRVEKRDEFISKFLQFRRIRFELRAQHRVLGQNNDDDDDKIELRSCFISGSYRRKVGSGNDLGGTWASEREIFGKFLIVFSYLRISQFSHLEHRREIQFIISSSFLLISLLFVFNYASLLFHASLINSFLERLSGEI